MAARRRRAGSASACTSGRRRRAGSPAAARAGRPSRRRRSRGVAALARPRQRARIERAPAARTRRLRATDVADRQRPATTGAAAILRHDFLSRPKTNPVPKMKSPARRRLQPVARFLLRGAAAAVLRRSAPSASYTAAPCLLFASQRHLLARRSPENSGPSVSARVQGHPGDSPATTGQFAPCRQSRLHAPAWIRTRV